MVNYSCPVCLKPFTQKSHYEKHIHKKRPCVNVMEKVTEIINKVVDDKITHINKTKTHDQPKQNEQDTDQYKFIDLFCGIGGFHQAFIKMNSKCVFACDIDEKCRKIYEKNYKIKPASDITKVAVESIPTFDILCGGFPCQPFSKAGFQKGFDDNRGNLFFTMCEIIKYHKPKYLLLSLGDDLNLL